MAYWDSGRWHWLTRRLKPTQEQSMTPPVFPSERSEPGDPDCASFLHARARFPWPGDWNL